MHTLLFCAYFTNYDFNVKSACNYGSAVVYLRQVKERNCKSSKGKKDMMKMYEEKGLWFVANAETNEVVYACNTEEEACHFICSNR